MNFRRFIGIDLAWTEKNPSALAILEESAAGLRLLGVYRARTLCETVELIRAQREGCEVSIGIDAPLKVPNQTGNREIEKAFLRDFAKYRIGMLPVNRTLMERMYGGVRGEALLALLEAEGFLLGNDVFEVYPHSTVAVCFNGNRILPYKRKKGRSLADVKEALSTYRDYLREAVGPHPFFDGNLSDLKGKALKEYEDGLDGITSAYALWFCRDNPERCKTYRAEGEGVFITPFPSA